MFKNKIWLGMILSIILLIFSANAFTAYYKYTQESGANFYVASPDKSDALEDTNEVRQILDDLGNLLGHSKRDDSYPKDLTTGGDIDIRRITTKTGVATLTIGEAGFVKVSAAAGYSLTLPTAVGNKLTYIFVKTDDNANLITIDGHASETINGSLTYTDLNYQYAYVAIRSDNANWYVLNRSWKAYTDTLHALQYLKTEMDSFSKIQAIISDKTLVNEEDVATIDATWTHRGLGETRVLSVDTFSATDTHCPKFRLRKSHQDTAGYTATVDNEDLGSIAIYGVGSDADSFDEAARILFEQDGAAGAAHVPGRIVFQTATNAAVASAVLTLNSDKTADFAGAVDIPSLTLDTALSPAEGGSGVANNAASTLTISGNFATTLTVTEATGVTLPASGTLATLAGTETLTNKTHTLPTIKGTTASDLPTYSAEFLDADNWTSVNWTGNWAAGWDHTTGNTTTLSHDHNAVATTRYQVVYIVTGRTAGTFDIYFGGQNDWYVSASGTWGPTATTTGILEIKPTTDFDGAIVISIKSITAISTPVATFKDSGGTTRIEVRANDALYNTYIGNDAGRYNTTGTHNVAIGRQCFPDNTTGYLNAAFGVWSMWKNTTGDYNAAFGGESLMYNTTGNDNAAFGYDALYGNTTGGRNTAVGSTAMHNNTTGSRNIALGLWAGCHHADGSTILETSEDSMYIGYNAMGKDNDDDNSIVIGYEAIGKGANTIVFGNTDITATYLYGDVRIEDDEDLTFGDNSDWLVQYDEGVDDQLLFLTAGTSSTATTDPMFAIIVGTTPTADQQVFGISKGTQASDTSIFTIDEDGDVLMAGKLTTGLTIVHKVVTIDTNDTTPQVTNGDIYVTSSNSQATEITDLDYPAAGQIVILVGGSNTNSSTIADGGNFALSAAMTLGLDDVITLFVQADNDYIEISRSDN